MAEGEKAPRKYGLYIPPKKTAARIVPVSQSLFDSKDDESKATPAVPAIDIKKRLVEKTIETALEEDPTTFLYDELVHEAPAKRQVKSAALPPGFSRPVEKTEVKKPQYMDALLKNAAERKAMNEVVKVKLMKKEAAIDAETFKDKDVIVTESYKRKLAEMQSKLDEDNKKALEEEAEKKKDMTGFYSNLLKNNVAFGSGTGGRIREQQGVSKKEVLRYGASIPAAKSPCSSESEEESFGPVRRR